MRMRKKSLYFGSVSSMKSVITCACVSSRISRSPIKRYSMSSVSFGSVYSTSGGTLDRGTAGLDSDR